MSGHTAKKFSTSSRRRLVTNQTGAETASETVLISLNFQSRQEPKSSLPYNYPRRKNEPACRLVRTYNLQRPSMSRHIIRTYVEDAICTVSNSNNILKKNK